MRASLVFALGFFFGFQAAPVTAQESTSSPTTATALMPGNDVELSAIRKTATEFENAFNAGDASAIASLWTEDGVYIDGEGQSFKGREAIAGVYKQMFVASKGQKIRVVIDLLELTNDTTATEQGRAILDPASSGSPAYGAYLTTHSKSNGKWLMSEVVDARVELPSTYDVVSDLDWLIGIWVAEENGATTVSECRWVASKSFVQRTYSVTKPDKTTTSGVQMIGYNPQGNHLQSWNFSPGGGYAVGSWWPRENGWMAEMRGTLPGGESSVATMLLTRLDDNAYAWQSIRRSVNGQPLPDTEEIVLKRQSK